MGITNGVLVGYFKIPSLFATLASALLFVGVTRLSFMPSWTASLPASAEGLSLLASRWMAIPVPAILFFLGAVALHLLYTITTPGKLMRAQGDNPRAAFLSGSPIRTLTITCYLMSALFGYLGALVIVGSTYSVNLALVNSTFVFDVLAVVILGGVSLTGGRGSVAGVMGAILLLSVVTNCMTLLDVGSEIQQMIKGGILLAAILIDQWFISDRERR